MKIKTILFLSAFIPGLLAAAPGFAQKQTVQLTAAQRTAMQKGANEDQAKYNELRKEFTGLLKKNDLAKADAAAQQMIALTLESAKKYAQFSRLHPARVYNEIASAFAGKKMYAIEYTKKWYGKALNAEQAPDAKMFAKQKYGAFLKAYYLADDATIRELMSGDFGKGQYTIHVWLNYANGCKDIYALEDLHKILSGICAKYESADQQNASQAASDQWLLNNLIRGKAYTRALAFCDKLLADKTIDARRKEKIAIQKADVLSYVDFPKALVEYETLLKNATENKNAIREQLVRHLDREAYRFYLPKEPAYLKKIIALAKDDMAESPAGQRSWTRMAEARIKAALELNDAAAVQSVVAEIEKLPDLAKKYSHLQKLALYAKAGAAYKAEDYPAALAALNQLDALFNGKYHHLPIVRIEKYLDMMIRTNCAVGDYKKALSYKDAFMKSANRPTRNRYQVYFDFLEKRAAE